MNASAGRLRTRPCRGSHRERREVAIEAAEFLKRKFPNCDIVVKDLQSGEVTAVAYKANTGPR